ncbi:Amidinotransferase [Candidatus Anstonella stagnisolia]|nr:Amidinotransferase [Candidatus Anstonella stagnisolia]
MHATAFQRTSPSSPARAPTIIRPSGFRPLDERAIALTDFFLDSVQNTKYKQLREVGEKFGMAHKNPDGLDSLLKYLFSGDGEKYLHSLKLFPFNIIDSEFELDTKLSLGCLLATLYSHPNLQVVDYIDAANYRAWRQDEWGYKTIVMSLPTYLDWGEPINKEEKANMGNKPDRFLAVMQHIFFIHALVGYGAKIILLRPSENCPEGVFTRDILIAVDGKILRAGMVAPIRQNEQEYVKNALVPPPEAKVEWGNLFLDKPKGAILLGVGDRTNMEGAKWVQHVAGSSYEVLPIHTKEGVLHLDCAFSRVGQMLYPGALENPKDAELLLKLYNRLTLLNEHQAKFLLANLISVHRKDSSSDLNLFVSASMLNLEDPAAYVLPTNSTPNIAPKSDPNATRSPVPLFHTLDATVYPVNLSEVTKAEGAHRCSTSPIL